METYGYFVEYLKHRMISEKLSSNELMIILEKQLAKGDLAMDRLIILNEVNKLWKSRDIDVYYKGDVTGFFEEVDFKILELKALIKIEEEKKAIAKAEHEKAIAKAEEEKALARVEEEKKALVKAEEENALAKAEEVKALARIEEEKKALAKAEEEKAIARVEEEKEDLAKAEEEKKINRKKAISQLYDNLIYDYFRDCSKVDFEYIMNHHDIPEGKDPVKWIKLTTEALYFQNKYGFTMKEFNVCFCNRDGHRFYEHNRSQKPPSQKFLDKLIDI
jgi:hypothetical protein